MANGRELSSKFAEFLIKWYLHHFNAESIHGLRCKIKLNVRRYFNSFDMYLFSFRSAVYIMKHLNGK